MSRRHPDIASAEREPLLPQFLFFAWISVKIESIRASPWPSIRIPKPPRSRGGRRGG